MSGTTGDCDGCLILVVDDDAATRLMLRRALEQEGYRVEEAVDGLQALAQHEQVRPDLVVMDAVMPVMDGFAACARLQNLPASRHSPVLIVTALDDEESVTRAFECGASDYIHKPIRWTVLRQRVRRMLSESRADRHVTHLAYHDPLTDLPNRRMLSEQLEQRIALSRRKGQPLALLFLDLDRFKVINDTLGHDVGDLLLRAVAERLTSGMRKSDIVGRLGGDEFTVVVERVSSAQDAAVIAQKVLKMLAEPYNLAGREVFATASMGVALYPFDGSDLGTLFKNADTAMYRAKDHGRNTYQFYSAEMSARAMERLALENSLRRALERHEFILHYQPQVELESGAIVGVEALIRWNHPEYGLVSPADFIPLAEDTGMILPIGEWVIATACAQNKAWQDAGLPPLRISVNLSGRQFKQTKITDIVQRFLRETGLDPQWLGVELTESSIMQQDTVTKATLWDLHNMGVHLSVDDFGTGYSSLSYLKTFPIDTLKIDRSFVRDVTTDPDDAAISSAIIAMAHSMKMQVIAEGVETTAQLNFLREGGCDAIQGYLVGKPMTAESISALLSQGKYIELVG